MNTDIQIPISENRYIAEHNCILRSTVGSTIHGLHVPGRDDRDEMGIFIEPPDYILGLKGIEQWTYRTQPEGVRSGPGDLDLTIYGLKKWANLAAKGNPTILILLFTPDENCSILTKLGSDLRAEADKFVSKMALRKYLGYMNAQYERLLGERGQMRVKRPELIEAFGYDTKYAMHALRLGFQGVELGKTGRLTLPMPEPTRTELYNVREGKATIEDVKSIYLMLQNELQILLTTSPLPNDPDWYGINSFLMSTYMRHWKGNLRIRQALKDWGV